MSADLRLTKTLMMCMPHLKVIKVSLDFFPHTTASDAHCSTIVRLRSSIVDRHGLAHKSLLVGGFGANMTQKLWQHEEFKCDPKGPILSLTMFSRAMTLREAVKHSNSLALLIMCLQAIWRSFESHNFLFWAIASPENFPLIFLDPRMTPFCLVLTRRIFRICSGRRLGKMISASSARPKTRCAADSIVRN